LQQAPALKGQERTMFRLLPGICDRARRIPKKLGANMVHESTTSGGAVEIEDAALKGGATKPHQNHT
jgi:hypothetical protein